MREKIIKILGETLDCDIQHNDGFGTEEAFIFDWSIEKAADKIIELIKEK